MKKLVLGTLMTIAAGIAGAMIGFLLVVGPAVIVKDAIANVLLMIGPTLGFLVGIGVGWHSVLRGREDHDYLDELRRQCSSCQYDLRGTQHDACPECGAPIPLKQHKYLANVSIDKA